MIRIHRKPATLMAFAAVALLGGGTSVLVPLTASAQESTDQQKTFDIAPGPLGQALTTFAQQAGVALSFDPSMAAGKTTTGLQGTYTIAQGFAALLQGTGLRAIPASKGSWSLRAQTTTALSPVAVSSRVVTPKGYAAKRSRTATKTDTELRDVPQSITVITQDAIRDQNMQNIADVVRNVPGVNMAQGEGNRDTPILRGNSTTADFFVDGLRDDVQYFRDLYNVERVEALKGPNAMIFGRGGVGGAINRVTKQADWNTIREFSLQGGSNSNRRIATDLGAGLTNMLAVRLSAMHENSDSYRDGVYIKRTGINPTIAIAPTDRTTIRFGYEFFDDKRIADRGIPSRNGRPFNTATGQFFGDPSLSPTKAKLHVGSMMVDHQLTSTMTIRNRTTYGSYDKFYQNVFPGAIDTTGATVSISAYNNATDRKNFFTQTDLVTTASTGIVKHTFLLGTEFGRQITDNFRETGFFNNTTTSVSVAVDSSRISVPVTFRQNGTDADNHGTANIAAVYVQDQITFSKYVQAILGARFDRFTVKFHNNRTDADFSSSDKFFSPRVGLIVKPIEPLSFYAGYSMTYQPRAGEQLSSLSLTNQSLDPEQFRNYEIGAKWDVRPELSVTAAVYRLDRSNVSITDPNDPLVTLLVDGQRTSGVEIGFNGQITNAWRMTGGYAYQNGKLTADLSATAPKGNVLASLPKNTVSLWNRYDVTPMFGVGVGASHQSKRFTSTDNRVVLPGFTRADGALYFTLNSRFRAQMNVENLFDRKYYSYAHSNNNITPGAPRSFRLQLTTSL